MSEDRLYVNHVEHITSLLMDLLIFWIKSIYFIAESMYLTLLPNKFRKLKVILIFEMQGIHVKSEFLYIPKKN